MVVGHQFKLSLRQFKSVFWFSILKFLEVVVTSLTTFLVAKKIGPAEMGKAIPILLFITYATYLSLGVNQVLLKNYSRVDAEGKSYDLVKVNFQYLTVVSFVSVIVSYIFINPLYAIYAAIISICTLFRSFFMSYFRVISRMNVLNKNNLVFSLLFLLSTLFFVESLRDYLFFWACSLATSLIFYFLDSRSFFIKIFKNIFVLPKKQQLIFSLSEGAKLAATGLVTTILLTSDRFIVNNLSIELQMKGAYQLADYVGTAYYMFFTTIIFYYYPQLISRLRDDKIFRKTYLKYLKIAGTTVPVLLGIIYFLAKFVGPKVFPEYSSLEVFVVTSVFIKSGVILVSSFSTYYIAINRENKYLAGTLPLLAAYLSAGVFYVYLPSYKLIYVPLTLGILLMSHFLYKIFTIENTNEINS
jgi:O-antigen/teichoic acid export membrane protein